MVLLWDPYYNQGPEITVPLLSVPTSPKAVQLLLMRPWQVDKNFLTLAEASRTSRIAMVCQCARVSVLHSVGKPDRRCYDLECVLCS